MKKVLQIFIYCYRAILTPFFGPACRFEPSCSHYAEEAVRKKGAARGLWLSTIRLLKCHPLHPGGYDPVKD